MKKLLILALVLMLSLSLVACNGNGGNGNSGNGDDKIGGSLDGVNGSVSGTDSGSNPGASDGETGDGSVPHTHTLTKTESSEATCTVNGNIEYYTCSGCSKLFADANAANEITILDTVIPAEHKLTFTAEVEATCKAEGNVAYYHCSVCEKNFENENGTGEIASIVTEKNDNHTGGTEIRDEKAPTEEEEGYTGDTYCLGCGEKIKEGTSINALNHVHAMSKVEASEKTCTENGNIEYYTCSKCGKYYTDENGANEITLADTVIAASHKLTYTEAKDATCKEDGNVAYYTCSSCSEKFSDADATNKITDVVIQKNNNHVGGTEIRDVKEATEEEEGYTGDTYCLGCGEKIADGESTDKLPHTHSMTKTEKTEATCTTDGNIEYYTCSKCGKYYTDENGTQEITLADTIINSSGHNYENNKCTKCGESKGSEDLKFTLNSDQTSYSVTGIGTCKDTDIIIPSTYNNLPVTSIGYYAFDDCTSLTSITIPNSVTSIGYYAFNHCYKLVEVYNLSDLNITAGSSGNGYIGYYALNVYASLDIPSKQWTTEDGFVFYEDGNTCYLLGYTGDKTEITLPENCNGKNYKIYKYAFYKNDKITKITIPNSVEFIGNYAFYDCSSLTSVTIPDSITSIGSYTFYDCRSLKSASIGNSVTSIDNRAFAYCTSLTSVTIPDSVTSIGDEAFSGCYKLAEVYNLSDLTITAGSEDNGLVGSYALNVYTDTEGQKKTFETEDGYLFYEDGNTCYLLGYTGDKTEITLPESCNGKNYEIYKYAFYYNDKLTKVIITNSVTYIGRYAFFSCSSLTSVTIGNNVTSIGDYAFYNCTAFTKIYFDATAINDLSSNNYVFYNAGKDGTGIKVVIGKNVTKIPAYLFRNSEYITSVQFEEGSVCNSIGEYAFDDCTSLTSITIPDSVEFIGNSAFSGCSSLTNVTIVNSVTSIGDYAFNYCTALEEIHFNATAMNDLSLGNGVFNDAGKNGNGIKVVIGKNVTKIPAYLFQNSEYITSVQFEEGSVCNSIGEYAFRSCTRLTSITIPNNVTYIGSYAFENCYGLTNITIPGNVTSISNDAFQSCKRLTSITIENGVTSIGSGAFRDCNSLTSITIPNSVTYIGSLAFYDCYHLVEVYNLSDLTITAGSYANGDVGSYAISVYTSLDIPSKQWKTEDGFLFYEDGDTCYLFGYTGDKTEITLPKSCHGKKYKIHMNAFSDNDKLTNVTIPDSVTSIGEWAFEYCNSLTSIAIPNSVTHISGGAFYCCTNLASVIIPNSITYIGDYAFEDCTSLTSITIPNSVVFIRNSAFEDCTSLEEVHISDIEAWCNISFSGYKANPLSTGANLYLNGKLLTELVVPDSVTSIGGYAFYGCTSLTSITIPDSVTSIGDYAFYDCDSLQYNEYDNGYYLGNEVNPYVALVKAKSTDITSCAIHNNTKVICNNAFSRCKSLTNITIPDSVTSIGGYAFSDCDGLTSVTIGNGVTSIGEWAFYHCSSLTSVTISDSVTSIGNEAFYDCTSLEEVHISDIEAWCNISFGGASANPLYYAKNLYLNEELVTELVIPDTVTEIKNYAFSSCTSLTSVTIPDSVTSISGYAFNGCASLTYNEYDNAYYLGNEVNPYVALVKAKSTDITSCAIHNNTKVICNNAFSRCKSLTSVTIPDSVTSISGYAFDGCTSLTSVTIEDSVTSIGYFAFYNCTSLTSVTIGDSVTSIGYFAFYNCTSLTSVTFENPNGWWYASSSSATSGTSISASDLLDAETAAKYLSDTYRYYYWKRS